MIYYLAIFHIFRNLGDELDEERIVKSATGIRNTTVWKKLYKFQRDGVVGAIDKLERLGGCVIADSVIETTETVTSAPVAIEENDIELPDLLTDLQDKTQLTRRSLVRILIGSGRLNDFKRNPQEFVELVAERINRTKRFALVDGIKYQRLGDEYYYAQELFEQEELTGYLRNMLVSTKSVYEHVVYDSSTVERPFAEQLEKKEAVKVYAKLPGWFKVPTPLGTYNPDWAVLIEIDGAERLYFVVETKSNLYDDDLRDKEGGKIECGKAHFKALAIDENPARFVRARNLGHLMGHVGG